MSVVVPLFNEANNVEPLYDALESVRIANARERWEYVFVDDGSRDDSLLVLARLADRDAKVKVVSLARNFGKEVALSAGVTYGAGDAVVTMDADLQHPPEVIPALLEKWRAGAEVVVAVRRRTARKAFLRRASSHLFDALARLFSGDSQVLEGTDFRLIDRRVRAAFLLVRERRRAYRQIVDWLGFVRETVPFDAARRHDGRSTYSLPKLWNLAIDMIVSRSAVPLRVLLYLGLLISFASTLSLMWMFLAFYYVDPKWWYTPLAQAVVFNTLLIGIVLIALGVVGLYVGRIHEEVLGRPLFLVRGTRNIDEPARARLGEDHAA
ncbi:Glycosyl transferase, family 2 [Labilithrix luteola]|uniref:Glycosyl transferase, family 2 n=1 Tax=Labilithrix luteola TaxID=1391654 RepID=A0A0K1QCD7_9BACT|nr:glycosyltransferase family 2 protein [Labilithrix luteola]AKV03095.1 Glycosyl transferase, family 2 [Labilithrix luteola]